MQASETTAWGLLEKRRGSSRGFFRVGGGLFPLRIGFSSMYICTLRIFFRAWKPIWIGIGEVDSYAL